MTKTKDYQFEPSQGFFGKPPTRNTYKYMQIGDLVVHEFMMGDVDDPDLYAAQPLWEWQQSEQGQWIMLNAIETPCWYRIPDQLQYGYKFQVRAKLSGPRLTEYLLRQS
jgi:hypothetical protein